MPFIQQRFSVPIAVLVAVLLVWLLYRLAFAAYWLVGIVLLLGCTYWLVRPELRTLLGSGGDRRPWLVRLREHRWRSVGLGGWRLPRGVVYLVVVVLWCLWL